MRIVNLMQETVRLMDKDDNVLADFPSEGCAEVRYEKEYVCKLPITRPDVDADKYREADPDDRRALRIDVPTFNYANGQVVGLPPIRRGLSELYVVHQSVAEAAPREYALRLLVPDRLVRDEDGRVIGCRGFATVNA